MTTKKITLKKSRKNDFAPIVLFVYKRLALTQLVINAILRNPEARKSDLIIFSDGPKNINDKNKVIEVRAYLKSLRGFKSIKLIFRKKNLGLANSFIAGITEVLIDFESAIFVEDDNLVSPGFLSFMNKALNYYRDDVRVGSVTGYSFPIWPRQDKPFFIRGATTWSMGIWRRSWHYFNPDSKALMIELEYKKLVRKLSQSGFGFYSMLQSQITGEIDSWGVRWWVSNFVNDMYCLYPHQPLCISIGYGDDSVHCKGDYHPLYRKPSELVGRVMLSTLPCKVKETYFTSIAIKLMNYVLFGIIWRLKSAFKKHIR